MAFSAEYVYRILDRYSGPMDKIVRSQNKYIRAVGIAQAKTKKFRQDLNKFGDSARRVGSQMTMRMTLPIIGLGLAAGKTAIDMQSGFIGVQKTVNASTAELDKMREQFKKMSTEIPVSVGELFKLGEAAGQLGIKTENITSFTRVMADLGATTNLTGEAAAMALSQFANVSGMSQKDFDRLGSTIAHLGNNLATTEADIVHMAQRLVGAGSIVGMTEAQIMSLAGAAKSVGIEAEAGGTAFSKLMLRLDMAVAKGGPKLRSFAKIAGMSAEKFSKAWKTDAAGALVSFTEGLGRIDKEGKNVAIVLERIGIKEQRMRDSLLKTAGAGDKFRKALAMGSKAWKENNALTKEANLRYGSWGSQLTIVWNKIKLVANEMGKILVPAFIALANIVVPVLQVFNKMPRVLKFAIVIVLALAAAMGPLLVVLGGMAFAITSIMYVLPVLSFWMASLGLSIASVLLPVISVVAAVWLVVYAFDKAWRHSDALRMAFANLGEALLPLWDGIKKLGEMMGLITLGDSADDFKTWGDELAHVINMVAGLIKGLLNRIASLGIAWGALSVGDWSGAVEATKNIITGGDSSTITPPTEEGAQDVNIDKQQARIAAKQAAGVAASGEIKVSASEGSKVDSASIGLNSGNNLATVG